MADGRAAEAGAAVQEALLALPGHEPAEQLRRELGALPATHPTAVEGAPEPASAARPREEPGPSAPAGESGTEPTPPPASEPAPAPRTPRSGHAPEAPASSAVVPPGPETREAFRSGAPVSASRRVEAEALTADALRHFMANEHDQARKVVDRALHLDPVNRRARELQRILRVLG